MEYMHHLNDRICLQGLLIIGHVEAWEKIHEIIFTRTCVNNPDDFQKSLYMFNINMITSPNYFIPA